MQIEIDKNTLSQAQKILSDVNKGFRRALSQSLNAATKDVKTKIIDIAISEYNFKKTAISKRISTTTSRVSTLSAGVKSSGRSIHLTDVKSTKQTSTGVSVNVNKATGRKKIPRTFIASGKNSGKKIVMRRPGKPRGQYRKLYGRYGPPGSGGKLGSRARLDVFYGPHPELIYKSNWPKIQDIAQKSLDKNLKIKTLEVFKKAKK